MGEANRTAGLWWLSDKPNNKIAGDLLIEERKLELTGSFEGMKPGVYGGSPKLLKTEQNTTIQGIVRNGGKKYTLEYFADPVAFTMHSYKADTYRLGDIFIGEHINKIENLAFDKYYIEFPYLHEWLNDGVITVSTSFQKEPLRRQSTTITVSDIKTTEIYKDKNVKLLLVSRADKVPMFSVGKNINIAQNCVLGIEISKGSLPLLDARRIIRHFERFLTIATGRSLEPTDIKVKAGNSPTKGYTTVLPYRSKKKDYKDIHIHDMNFTFEDIKARRKAIFTKWFADNDKYADIFDLFSVLRSDVPKMLENEFKDIVGAIEGYVRIEQNNLDISLDKAIKTVNEALPKNDRPLTKNDYKKIRITRNKLSHMATKPEDLPFILNHEEMWFTFEKLLVLFEYSLLKNLGLSQKMLKKFYDKRKNW